MNNVSIAPNSDVNIGWPDLFEMVSPLHFMRKNSYLNVENFDEIIWISAI